jgi:hypothetical protein
MNYGQSFTYVTEDENWIRKVLIGALLVFTGIGNIAVMGWMIEIISRVLNDESEVLPDWSDIGEYFISGLKFIGVIFIWLLPIIVVSVCLVGAIFVTQGEISVDSAGPIITITSICLSSLIVIYSIVIGFLYPVVLGRLAQGISFGDVINPAKSFSIFRHNAAGFIISAILGSFVTSIFSSLGAILCCVGSFFGTSYGYTVFGHTIGQAFRIAIENMGPETTLIEEELPDPL